MNPKNYNNLRWCERYKSTIAYTHVEAFAKKIRKKKDFQHGVINANTQQREIDVFYKEGWEYQHAHSTLTCDISDPVYLQQRADLVTNENLSKYYEDCQHFIQRLKTQHEDQTAFRVQARYIQPLTALKPQQLLSPQIPLPQKKNSQNLTCSKQVYRNFITTIEQVVKSMLKNVEKYDTMDIDIDVGMGMGMDGDGDGGMGVGMGEYGYLRVKDVFHVLDGWLEALKGDCQDGCPVWEWIGLEHVEEIGEINQYMVNFMQAMQQMKENKRSCVFNYQPQISVLTHLIHPILLSTSSLLHKQRLTWQNPYQHNPLLISYSTKIPSPPLLPDTPHHQLSRVAFINFDGYESQFNIQMAKNLSQHLMYVSFPVLQGSYGGSGGYGGNGNGNGKGCGTFDGRFYKKLMYNFCREMYQYQCQDFDVVYSNNQEQMDMNMQELDLRKQLQLKYDPQKYFTQIQKLHKNPLTQQSTKNLYIFPLKFKHLQQQLSPLFLDSTTDASNPGLSSYFIWYLFRSFIFDDLRKFNPTHVVVSYSGIVDIGEDVWAGIVGELGDIGARRVMFVPNFGVGFTENLREEYQYDNFVKAKVPIEKACNLDLMKKMSQFLKITSGTYNLQKPSTPDHLIPRHKLSKLTPYIRGLLNALSTHEYPHLRNRISDLFLRLDSLIITRSLQQHKKQIKSSIPTYYQELFKHIRNILGNQSNKYPQDLGEVVDRVRKEVRKGRDGRDGREGRERDGVVEEMVRGLELGVVSQRFSEVAYVYFKTKPDRVQFEQLKQQIKQQSSEQSNKHSNPPTNNNLQDLYSLSLRITSQTPQKQKQTLQIYPQTQLHYRQNQTHKFRTPPPPPTLNPILHPNPTLSKKTANIILINHLKDSEFVSYAGLVTLLAGNQVDKNKQKICNQRVEMYQVGFYGGGELGAFCVRAGWNYAETSRYYFLYWPKQYNILQAKLRQLNDEPYQPRLLNEIFISEIPQTKQHRLSFHRSNVTDQSVPRHNCSTLQLFHQNKIFILGGFYQREFNYLSLQTEITGLDLSHYNGENRKCVVTNEKGVLYDLGKGIEEDGEGKEKRRRGKNNSYVRARREYEIFQLEQLCELREEEIQRQGQVRSYVMIGGFGENFVRPYSLMSCHYYKIDIDLTTKTIKSIERNILYQKILTCNIKGYIKNNGFFQRLALYQKNLLKPNQQLTKQSYIAHRSIYTLSRQQTPPQILTKTKYHFAINLFTNIKTQYEKLATKIGQYIDTKTNTTSQFLLSLSSQGNHYLTIRKNRNQIQTIQIYLQKMEEKNMYQYVPLTHGSIVSIDVKFKYVYAIVRHDFYTKGKFVLAQCQMANQQADVVLRIVHSFGENLEQFYLFVPRPMEVLLLHGISFDNVGINDFTFRIPKKQSSKQQPIKKIPPPSFIPIKKYKKCYTVMIKDQHKQTKSLQIDQLNLLLPYQPKPESYLLRRYRLTMSTSPQFLWQPISEHPIQFLQQSTNNLIHILRIQSTRILQQQQQNQPSFYACSSPMLSGLSGYSEENLVLVKIYAYNKRSYIGVVNLDGGTGRDSRDFGRVVVVNAENVDARRIWELAMPIQHHIKSINKYKDMEIIA